MNGRSSSSTGVQHWLRAELVDYTQRDLVFSHIDALLAAYTLLKPKRELFIYDDGRAQHLVSLAGLLPITYRNASYNIPISIWLPFDYPKDAPIVYVVPTKEMVVKASRDLDPGGKWMGEYLRSWGRKPETCNLKTLCETLQDIFGREPPLYRKAREELGRSASASSTSSPARPPSQGSLERPPLPPPRPLPPGVQEARDQSPAYSPSPASLDPRARPPPPLPGQNGGPYLPKPQSTPPRPESIASPAFPAQQGSYHPTPLSLPPYGYSPTPYSTQRQPDPPSRTSHAGRYSGPPPPPTSPPRGPAPPFSSQPGSPSRPPPLAYQPTQQTPVQYPAHQPPQPPPLPSQLPYQTPSPPVAPYPIQAAHQPPAGYVTQQPPPPPVPPQPPVQRQSTGWQNPQTHVDRALVPTQIRQVTGWQPTPAPAGAPSPYPQQSYQAAPPQVPAHPPVYPSLPDAPQHRSRPSIPQPDFLSSDPEPMPSRSSSPPPPLPPNPHILSLHMSLLGQIQQRLSHQLVTAAAEMDRLRTIQNELAAGPARIQDEMARLAAVRDVCSGVVNRLEGVVKEAEGRLYEVKARGEVPVDEIVCADSIVGNQLMSLVAEDNAIEDTLYHLHRALNSGRIDLDRFIKTTRALSEEQFMKRALMEKILNGLPMGLWSPH